MIEPPWPRSTIALPKTWQASRHEVRFVWRTRFHSSSPSSKNGVPLLIPTALTRMSTGPSFASTAFCAASTEARSEASSTNAAALTPFAVSAATSSSERSCDRSRTAIAAPASPKPWQTVPPRTPAPPTTAATLPERSKRPVPEAEPAAGTLLIEVLLSRLPVRRRVRTAADGGRCGPRGWPSTGRAESRWRLASRRRARHRREEQPRR